MRITIIPVGAAVMLLASYGWAGAQGHMHGFGGGGGHGPGGGGFHGPGGGFGGFQGPRGGGGGFSPGGGFRSGPSMMPHGNFQGPRAHRAERAPRMEHSYRGERTGRAEHRRFEHSQRAYSQQTRRAESRARRAESARMDRSQRAQRELTRRSEVRRAERLRSNERTAQERRGHEEKGRLEQRVAERHTKIQNARMQLSGDNKERLHQAFNMDRARVHNVNFDFHVGRRIPRHIHLFTIPAAVFAFFPYYEGYSYFVVDDDICIVDPRTYVVVDVIDAGYWSGPGRPYVAGLRLSVREMDVVREGIPADFPDAGIHLRLALGAEIPEDIQLHEFAPFVLDRLPKLRGYAFLVTGDQIVIVQPRDRSIALVIDRA
jgi:Protein of unknown function (DUF1236)